MLNEKDILEMTDKYCEEHGGKLRSRQVRELALAIVEKVNEELDNMRKDTSDKFMALCDNIARVAIWQATFEERYNDSSR